MNKINIKLTFRIIIISLLHILSLSNVIQMNAAFNNTNAGSISLCTFSIFRNISSIGAIITPSSLNTSFSVQVSFGQYFNINSASINTSLFPGYSINSSSNIVTIPFNTASSNSITFTINNLVNPFTSSISNLISIQIYNSSSSTIIDNANASYYFITSSFSSINTWNDYFTPGNVSTLSNFSFTFQPDFWTSNMSIKIGFNQYWTRSIQNVSSTAIFTSSSRCEPICSITMKSSYIQVLFSSVTLTNGTVFMTFININSPPSLEPIDIISISSIQNNHSSIVQVGSMTINSLYPNYLQGLTAITSNLVGQQVLLTVSINTKNIFWMNDTISINLSSPFQATALIDLSNPLVSSYIMDTTSLNLITFSNFNLLTSSPSTLNFSLSIANMSTIRSTKPVTNNIVQISRYGYLYNYGAFDWSVQINSVSSFSLNISNNFANSNSTLRVSAMFVQTLIGNDSVILTTPSQILVYSDCIPLQCIGCSCIVQANSSSSLTSKVTVSNFPNAGIQYLSLLISIRNPIVSSSAISICHQDSQKYAIQCSSSNFPAIQQSTLSTSVINFTSSSNIVYDIATYTIAVNLTSYDLNDGYLLMYFDKSLYIVNSSIIICTVNSQPSCSIVSTSQIIINVTVYSSIKTYSIVLSNIRNPTSTQQFQFNIDIYGKVNNSYLIYYSVKSDYFRVTQPYNLTNYSLNRSSCVNSASSILSINMSNLPFLPSSALLIDNPNSINVGLVQQTIGMQVLFNTSMQISLLNYYSMGKNRYSFLIKTSDIIYSIFQLNLIVQNCQPSYLSLDSYQISGLLGQQGYISLVFSTYNPISYAYVYFPTQFASLSVISSNSLFTTNVSPRVFMLTLPNTQPISLQIWNFTQSAMLTNYFNIQTYSKDSNNNSYIVSRNNNTIVYNLSSLTGCAFPCKLCSPNNYSVCVQCYTSLYTNSYFLVNGSCLSSCPSGYYTFNLTCIVCPSQCLTCNSTFCILCTLSYYYLNGSCLTNCPSTHYSTIQNSKQVCVQCVFPCLNCVNSSICLTCSSNYYLSSSETCVTTCDSNYYAINGVCRQCQSPCYSCSQSLTNCTSCSVGYYFYLNSCLPICPSPLAPNSNNICVVCEAPCNTCSASPTTCSSCQSPYKLSLGVCLTNCPNGYYEYLNVCIGCSITCKQCLNSTYCNLCQSGYSLYNFDCVSICPAKYYSQLIISTSYNNGSYTCVACSQNCLNCANVSQCYACSIGTYLLNKVCISTCPSTYFQNINICSPCSTSCQYCISNDICSVCSDSSNLLNNSCVLSCPYTYTQINITVVLTSNVSAVTKYCQSCSSLFQNCLNCTTNKCQQCMSNYTLNQNSQCAKSCSSGYIDLNNLGYCIKCDISCFSCVGLLNNCSECSLNYWMLTTSSIVNGSTIINNQCLLNCPYPLLNYSSKCIACTAPCATCVNNPNFCATCLSSLILYNGTCIAACPPKSYLFSLTCISCSASCQVCNQNGCLNCDNGYLISPPQLINNVSYYQCFTTCPTYLSYIINGSVCSKCSENCASCNSNQCLQCQGLYLRYGQYCVLSCPPPLVSYQNSCVNTSSVIIPVPVVVIPTFFSFPVPYTIVLALFIACCILSKFQYENTSLSLSIYGLGCMLTLLCNVHYFSVLIQQSLIQTILLLISLIITYFTNILFLLLGQYTLLKDDQFLRFIKVHYLFYIFTVIGFLTTHTNYVIFFSKLFNLSFFKAHLQQIRSLKFINYLWAPQILAYLLAVLAAIMKQLMVNKDNLTGSQQLQLLYQCIDLIVLNTLMMILAILLFNKSKQLYLKREDDLTTQSTKKVIFDQSSIHNFGSVQSMQEFKVQDKNFRIYNQALMEGLIPQQSEGGFTYQETKVDDNYDLALMFASQYQQNYKTQVQQTENQLQSQDNTNVKLKVQKQVHLNMGKKLAIQSQVNVFIADEQMEPQLQNMKQVLPTEQKEPQLQNMKQVLQHKKNEQAKQVNQSKRSQKSILKAQSYNIFQQNHNQSENQDQIIDNLHQQAEKYQNQNKISQQNQEKHIIQINPNQKNDIIKKHQLATHQLSLQSQYQSINQLSQVAEKSCQDEKNSIQIQEEADLQTQIDFHQNQISTSNNEGQSIYLTNTLRQQNNQSMNKSNIKNKSKKIKNVRTKADRYEDFHSIPDYMFAQKKQKQKQARISDMQTLFIQQHTQKRYGFQTISKLSIQRLSQLRRSRSVQNSNKNIQNMYLNQTFRQSKPCQKSINKSISKTSQKHQGIGINQRIQKIASIKAISKSKEKVVGQRINQSRLNIDNKKASQNKKKQYSAPKPNSSQSSRSKGKNLIKNNKDQQLNSLINYRNLSGKSRTEDIKHLVNEIQRKQKIRVKVNQVKSMYTNR